jgi:hypothetical protein
MLLSEQIELWKPVFGKKVQSWEFFWDVFKSWVEMRVWSNIVEWIR